MKFNVQQIEEIRTRNGRTIVSAILDIPYIKLIHLERDVPRPSKKPKPHDQTLRLRVRLTRPDGVATEPFASVGLVSPLEASGIMSFEGVSLHEVPVGSGIELLRYEIHERA